MGFVDKIDNTSGSNIIKKVLSFSEQQLLVSVQGRRSWVVGGSDPSENM